MLIEHRGIRPEVHPGAYVAPTAVVCGAVRIGRAHINGARVHEGCFLATGAAVFPGAVVGAGSEVRIHAVVHVNSALAPGSTVPIGWIAVGDPAVLLPPERHEEIWAAQQPLDFPGTVHGVPRGTPPSVLMARQSQWFGAHLDDRIIEDQGPESGPSRP